MAAPAHVKVTGPNGGVGEVKGWLANHAERREKGLALDQRSQTSFSCAVSRGRRNVNVDTVNSTSTKNGKLGRNSATNRSIGTQQVTSRSSVAAATVLAKGNVG